MQAEKLKMSSSTKKIALRLLIVVIVVCSAIGSFKEVVYAAGSSYYVSPTGSDSNPGTMNQPWKTIGKAVNTAAAGDTVNVRSGTYQEQVYISTSGTSSAMIIFQAYPGETPIIDGNNTIPGSTGGGLIQISGSYVRVSGFEVRNSAGAGVILVGKNNVADHINANHNHNSGILIIGDYGVAEFNTVWSNSMENVNGSSPNTETFGISAARSPNYAVIKNNVEYGSWGEGISTFESNGTTIEDNIVYDSWTDNIYISDATNVVCQRNFVYATGAMNGYGSSQTGIYLGDETYNPASANIKVLNNIAYNNNRNLWWGKGPKTTSGMNNVLIANNTFVNSTTYFGVQLNDSAYHQNVTFENNIIEQDGTLPVIYAVSNPQVHYSNNLWSKAPISAASGSGDVIADPMFAKTGQPSSPAWYKLATSSPAIHKALPISDVSIDYFSDARGSAADIGADQFMGASSATNTPVVPTATQINTQVPPAATNTPVPVTPTSQPTSADTATVVAPPLATPTSQPTSADTATVVPPPLATPTSQPTSANTATVVPPPLATPTRQPTSASTATVVPPPLATPTKPVAPTSPPSQTTLQLNPVADAFVSSSHPSTNYGTNTYLDVRYNSSMRSFLRFNITGLNGKAIKSATLRLRANTASSVPIYVHNVSSNTWAEKGITYNTKPSLGTTKITGPQSYQASTWISIDVTSLVKGEGLMSLAVTLQDTANLAFGSRESGSNAPQLVIVTAP